MEKNNRNLSIFVLALFIALFILSIFIIIRHSTKYTEKLISNDILKINKALMHIHETAGIVGFSQDHSLVDFLNVRSFEGSMVGALNLVDPKKWQGPYVKTNPTIQERFYEVIKTKNGYFIVPGNGVKLSNKKIIGKDIIFNYDTDVEKLMQENSSINKGQLARKIDWTKRINNDESFINPFISTEDSESY